MKSSYKSLGDASNIRASNHPSTFLPDYHLRKKYSTSLTANPFNLAKDDRNLLDSPLAAKAKGMEQLEWGLLWTSATGMSLSYLSLPPKDSDSVFRSLRNVSGLRQYLRSLVLKFTCKLTISQSQHLRLPVVSTDTTSKYVFIACFTIASVAFIFASHTIYARAEKTASRAILVSLGFLACQMVWGPSFITSNEIMLVLLPLTISAGLSWAVVTEKAAERSNEVTYPVEKS